MQTATLQNVILIQFYRTIKGGCSYKEVERSSEEYQTKGEKTQIKTEKLIEDVKEYNDARALRERINTILISGLNATKSMFGILCADTPENWKKIEELESQINEETDKFNRDAIFSRLVSSVIALKTEGNQQANRAILETIRDAIDELKEAVKLTDPDAIRAALKSAKGIDRILQPEAGEKFAAMMDELRARARKITSDIKKNGAAIDATYKDTSAIDAAALAIFPDDPELQIAALPALDASDLAIGQIDFEAGEAAPETAPGIDETDERPAAVQAQDAPGVDTTEEKSQADDWKDDPTPEKDPLSGFCAGCPRVLDCPGSVNDAPLPADCLRKEFKTEAEQ